jgi:hypothetical protein
VNSGGNLLIIGANAVRDFKEALDVEVAEAVHQKEMIYVGVDERIVRMKTNFLPFTPNKRAINIGSQLTSDDWRFTTGNHYATIVQHGKGKIGGLFIDIGNYYNEFQNPLATSLLQKLISAMVPSFVSSIKSCDGNLHQVVSRKNNLLYVHLINTNGPHSNPNVLTYDEVAPVKNVQLEVRSDKSPKSVKLQPGNKNVPFSYNKGLISFTIPSISIYTIVEIH